MYSGYKKEEYVKNPKLRDFFDLIMGVSAGHDHDGVNSKAVSVGTVSDEAVTNAKLATDVKIGSLASLTTTSKASVVGAVNELDAEIGTISGLSTSAKSTIVEAINEVDAHADAAAASQAGMVTLTGTQNLTNKTLISPKIDDTDAGLTLTSADQTHGSATATFPDLGDAADEVVMKDTAQALANKTLTTPVVASLYQDAGKTKLMTIPDTASDTLAAIAATQTLTNKTLTTPKIATGGSINDAGGDEYLKFVEATTPVTYIQITSGDTTVPPKIQGAGETNIDLHLLGSGTGKVVVSDGTDPTKTLNFNVAGATTGKYMSIVSSHTDDRVLTLPDATDTVVGRGTTDTLTNKTLTAPVITSPDLTFASSAVNFAGGHADYTLSAGEEKTMFLVCSNADAGASILASATANKVFCVINGSGQTITILVSGQTGIAIANGKSAFVRCNGTDYARLTGDA